jgi:hypothetical protein
VRVCDMLRVHCVFPSKEQENGIGPWDTMTNNILLRSTQRFVFQGTNLHKNGGGYSISSPRVLSSRDDSLAVVFWCINITP